MLSHGDSHVQAPLNSATFAATRHLRSHDKGERPSNRTMGEWDSRISQCQVIVGKTMGIPVWDESSLFGIVREHYSTYVDGSNLFHYSGLV